MSISLFSGFVTGVVSVQVIVLLALWLKRRKGVVQADERTELIRGRAALSAVVVTGVLLFIAWVGDNLLTYSRGGTIRFLTPWSISVLMLLVVFMGTYAYFYQKNSADETDEATMAEKRRLALASLLLGLSMIPMAISEAAGQDLGLKYLLFSMSVLQLAMAGFLGIRTYRRVGAGK